MAYPFAAAEVLTAANLNAMIGAPTQNAQTGVTYTLALLDAGKTVTFSNAAAVAVTLPLQATVAWLDNCQINLLNLGAGTVTIAGAVGVTINGTPLTLATSEGGSLIRTASNTWTFVPAGASTWTSWTPTVSTSSGTITTYTILFAKYIQIGKLVHCMFDIQIDDNGTGAGNLLVTAPVTIAAAQRGFGSGLERSATGNQVQVQNANTTQIRINTYNNGYPGGTNYRINAGYTFEAA